MTKTGFISAWREAEGHGFITCFDIVFHRRAVAAAASLAPAYRSGTPWTREGATSLKSPGRPRWNLSNECNRRPECRHCGSRFERGHG
jgi:hypothetical protein